MDITLSPVSLEASRAAAENIKDSCLRTPLVRLNWEAPAGHPGEGVEIYLKLESLQPVVNSFKIRGAGNAIAHALKEGAPAAGTAPGTAFVTASAGNMAQGVAATARRVGRPCVSVVPDHAPQAKLAAIERLGGAVIKVPFDEWWEIIRTGECPRAPGHFVHPVLDPHVLAGNSTIALEIVEDLPDVAAVCVPYGGGALTCGIASVMRELRPSCRLYSCEPETAAPLAKSFAEGCCSSVDYEPTFVDGCGGKSVLEPMWPLARSLLTDALAVPIRSVAEAVRVVAERNKVIAEGAGACPVAAAMLGKAGRGKVVCVASGGGIDTAKLVQILAEGPAGERRPLPKRAGAAAAAGVALGACLAALLLARRR